jgi:23S rRNA (guanine2445-N2)-methyltransferase / 23S rRNA (guanine2069-N7)-methyltransferase
MLHRLYVTAPAGTADLAAKELEDLGAVEVKAERGGVSCHATLEQAYRACLWSRVANRVLLPIAKFPATSAEALYAGVRTIDWAEHLAADGTLAVDCTGSTVAITHTQFAALKVKDAVVDQFRDRTGGRPSVDVASPDVRINLHLHRDTATLAIDLSGDSLHRRGYRGAQGAAPLKENLAAAILLRSGWATLVAERGAAAVGFVDPMCGSGTLPIEAALIAGDIAPGLLRGYFGFVGWRRHDAALWERLMAEARERRTARSVEGVEIAGYDRDAAAVRAALANAARAGVADRVAFERRDLEDVPAAVAQRGLVAVNPPYGERLGDVRELAQLYERLGSVLRERYRGWNAAVLTGNPPLGRELGLHAKRTHRMFNGPLECRLLRFELAPSQFAPKRVPGALPTFDAAAARARPGAQMFANRLRKNYALLSKWAKRESVACYRVYDADMPEYAFSIDLYRSGVEESSRRWAYVQEYAPPDTIERAKARARREEVFAVIPEVLAVAQSAVHARTRRRQKGGTQYAKLGERGDFHEVAEGDLKFLVNFTDYLDTGLFLDHRPTRTRLRSLAAGKRFLNLFGYTGTASVHAAVGGAQSTTTVDMSRTYLEWAKRNFALNGITLDGRHRFLQEDALAWLAAPADAQFDLVFLDPPTVSRSKRMTAPLDVQRDHVDLIRKVLRRLAPGGLLLFSTNFRKFRLDRAALADLTLNDITQATIPKDFARDAKIHQCFEIRAPH